MVPVVSDVVPAAPSIPMVVSALRVMAPLQVVLEPAFPTNAPVPLIPLPLRSKVSTLTVMSLDNLTAAPSATVTPPAVSPKAILFCAFITPALIAVAPV